MKFSEDFLSTSNFFHPIDPIPENSQYKHNQAQERAQRKELNVSKPATKLDAVKKVEEKVKEVKAVRNTAETRRLKVVSTKENIECVFCETDLPSDDSEAISSCGKCKARLHTRCKDALGKCPKCLVVIEKPRISIEEAMKLRDEADPPPLPKLECHQAAVKRTIGEALNHQLALREVTGTPLLPTAVKAGTTTTPTKPTVKKPTPTTTKVPTPTTTKVPTPSVTSKKKAYTADQSAQIQEWKGKITRLLKQDSTACVNCKQTGEIKREHIVAAAIAFMPRHKKLPRIRTIMKMLDIDGHTAKAIYDDAGMSEIPFITHPGIESAQHESMTIMSLNKKLLDGKKIVTDLAKEVSELDFEAQTAKEACVSITVETLKVLNFLVDQFKTIFDGDDPYVSQEQFNFAIRVLENEVKTFNIVKRRAENEITDPTPVVD